ncbi:hypothetical protein LXL04_033856 [Taraxacum kok-saghyz]
MAEGISRQACRGNQEACKRARDRSVYPHNVALTTYFRFDPNSADLIQTLSSPDLKCHSSNLGRSGFAGSL